MHDLCVFLPQSGPITCQEAALGFPDLANPAVAADGVDQEGTSQKVHTHWVGGCRRYKDAAPGIRCQGNCAKIETKKTNSENALSGEWNGVWINFNLECLIIEWSITKIESIMIHLEYDFWLENDQIVFMNKSMLIWKCLSGEKTSQWHYQT